MPTILSLSLIFLLLLSPALGSETEGEKNFVLTLDASNFTETVAKHAFIVVEFYAPWCGHCVKLAPEYEKAASVLASHDPPLVLAKVDATEEKNKEIAGQFEVKGFPTIKILRNGGKTSQEYKGTREADGIVAYLKRQAGPASVEITSPEDVGRLFDDRKAYIVGIFPQLSGEEFENFTAVAEKLRSDYDFGHTLEAKYLPRGESAATGPLVRLFKPFDEMVLDFQDFHLEVVEEFIKKSSIPTVTLFDKDPINHPYLMKFFDSSDAKAMLFINFTSESLEAFKSKLHEVASNYKGKGISFLLADAEAAQGAFKFFGAREDMVPVMVISKGEEEEKYLKPNLEPDHIASWLRDFTEGKLQPFKKTEPIPESNNEPVKVVVAATLQEMVFNSGKNVLLEFYAPWCGHCKKLAPTLDEVALFFETNKDVIIAKIDATANDVPSSTFKVTGFPTLYLVSANGKVVQYEGDRSKDDIIGFVQKNSDSTAGQAESTTPSVKDEL